MPDAGPTAGEFAVVQQKVVTLTDDVAELKRDVKALRTEDIPDIRETLARMEESAKARRTTDFAGPLPRWVGWTLAALVAVIAGLLGIKLPL
jgi:hypothetical protein